MLTCYCPTYCGVLVGHPHIQRQVVEPVGVHNILEVFVGDDHFAMSSDTYLARTCECSPGPFAQYINTGCWVLSSSVSLLLMSLLLLPSGTWSHPAAGPYFLSVKNALLYDLLVRFVPPPPDTHALCTFTTRLLSMLGLLL